MGVPGRIQGVSTGMLTVQGEAQGTQREVLRSDGKTARWSRLGSQTPESHSDLCQGRSASMNAHTGPGTMSSSFSR